MECSHSEMKRNDRQRVPHRRVKAGRKRCQGSRLWSKVADTPSEGPTRLGFIRQIIFKILRHLIFKMTRRIDRCCPKTPKLSLRRYAMTKAEGPRPWQARSRMREPRQAAGQARSSKLGDRRCRPLCLSRMPQAGAAGATLESLLRPAPLTAWVLSAGERGFSVVSPRVTARGACSSAAAELGRRLPRSAHGSGHSSFLPFLQTQGMKGQMRVAFFRPPLARGLAYSLIQPDGR